MIDVIAFIIGILIAIFGIALSIALHEINQNKLVMHEPAPEAAVTDLDDLIDFGDDPVTPAE